MKFADTNVLLYAISRDPNEQEKAERANQILAGRELALSVQVLQEFYVNARRKLGLDGPSARSRIEVYLAFEVVTVTPSLLLAAVDLNRLDSLSFWDALIVRAAEAAGCDTLYSEDLQAGRRFGPVRVVNPFA